MPESLLQDHAHRRPYEVLMLLRPTPAMNKSYELQTQAQPEGLVMLAVPGEHSRKPQLAQLLQPYLPANPKCLEVSQTYKKRYPLIHVTSAHETSEHVRGCVCLCMLHVGLLHGVIELRSCCCPIQLGTFGHFTVMLPQDVW